MNQLSKTDELFTIVEDDTKSIQERIIALIPQFKVNADAINYVHFATVTNAMLVLLSADIKQLGMPTDLLRYKAQLFLDYIQRKYFPELKTKIRLYPPMGEVDDSIGGKQRMFMKYYKVSIPSYDSAVLYLANTDQNEYCQERMLLNVGGAIDRSRVLSNIELMGKVQQWISSRPANSISYLSDTGELTKLHGIYLMSDISYNEDMHLVYAPKLNIIREEIEVGTDEFDYLEECSLKSINHPLMSQGLIGDLYLAKSETKYRHSCKSISMLAEAFMENNQCVFVDLSMMPNVDHSIFKSKYLANVFIHQSPIGESWEVVNKLATEYIFSRFPTLESVNVQLYFYMDKHTYVQED